MIMDEERKARKNAYMKEYLRRYRKTEKGKAVQKAIKSKQRIKYKIENNLSKLAKVAQEFVEHHAPADN